MIKNLPIQTLDPISHDTNSIEGVPDLVETQSVFTRLPVISLFTLRSPVSNLIISPACNQRSVAIAVFNNKDPKTKKSLADVIVSADQTAFCSRPLIAYPFTVKQQKVYTNVNTDTTTVCGVPLTSISSGDYVLNTSTKNTSTKVQNVKVQINNMFAVNASLEDVKQTLALLGIPLALKNGNNANSTLCLNWVDIVNRKEYLRTLEDLQIFVRDCGWPTEFFITNEQSYEATITKIHQFIMMCTGLFFCFPEGQHRVEITSRPVYGYGLSSPAPLQTYDLLGPNEKKALLASLEPTSPIHGDIMCRFLLPTDPTKNFPQTLLVKRSTEYQTQANLEVSTSHLVFFQTVKTEIDNRFSVSFAKKGLEANVWNDTFAHRRTKKKSAQTGTNLQQILAPTVILVCQTVNDRVFNSEPYRSMVKECPENFQREIDQTEKAEKDNTDAFFTTTYSLSTYKIKIYTSGKMDPNNICLAVLTTHMSTTNTSHKMLKNRQIKDPAVGTIFEFFVTLYMWDSLPNELDILFGKWQETNRNFSPHWLEVYVVSSCQNIATFLLDQYTQNHYKPPEQTSSARSTPKKPKRVSARGLASPSSNTTTDEPSTPTKPNFKVGQYAKGRNKLRMSFRCAFYQQVLAFIGEAQTKLFPHLASFECLQILATRHAEELQSPEVKEHKHMASNIAVKSSIDALLLLYFYIIYEEYNNRKDSFFKGFRTESIETAIISVGDETNPTNTRNVNVSDLLPEELLLENLIKEDSFLKTWCPSYIQEYKDGSPLTTNQTTSRKRKHVPTVDVAHTFDMYASIMLITIPKLSQVIKYAKGYDMAQKKEIKQLEKSKAKAGAAKRATAIQALKKLSSETEQIYHNLERIMVFLLDENKTRGNQIFEYKEAFVNVTQMIAAHIDLDSYVSCGPNDTTFLDDKVKACFTEYLTQIDTTEEPESPITCPTTFEELAECIPETTTLILYRPAFDFKVVHNLNKNLFFIAPDDELMEPTEAYPNDFLDDDSKYPQYKLSSSFWESELQSDAEPSGSDNDDNMDEHSTSA